MMKRLVLTDLRRAQRKKAFIICMVITVLLIIIMAIISVWKPSSADTMMSGETSGKASAFLSNFSIAYGLMPFLIGIPIYSTVFTDDFKSRTMQTAIGRGISRRRLILARFYEVLALLVESLLIFSVIGIVIALAFGASMSGIGVMIGKMWFSSVLLVANVAIAMLVLYMTQNPTGGLVLYILLAADAFRLLLLLLEMIPFLKDNKIKPSYILPSGVYELASDYLFGREASVDLSKATEGNIEDMIQAVDPNLAKAMLYIVILVGVFIILPLILSQTVFRKKELEF